MSGPDGPGPGTTPARPRAVRRRSVGAAVVGVLGELLVTLGVLLGLFVVWQLWWTDVVAGQRQAELVSSMDWVRSEAQPAPTPAPSAEPTGPRDPTDPPPVIDEPAFATTFASLQVPRWGPDYLQMISQGTTRREILDVLGLGHYEGTAMPGQVGNFAVAGHRTTYGKPLNRVEELQVGDALVVQTPETWYVYTVSSTEVVTPRDVQVIAPVPGQPGAVPTGAVMTLTTCHPMYSARERFIVHADLKYWMPVADGTPAELTGGA
ncbi:class E sortase [Actinotalea subterranea]|uniref:class E sortase n=1 Tax=Actinotalea subterranea TaxID=2607497 RepID=UPI0011ECABC1|nr:class E sortase [Actinotalea subterranea]